MYPKKLLLKLEHFGSHATVLHLDITINNGEISTKLYDKHDDFSFFIVRMPNFHCNIRSSIFYGIVVSKILRIATLSSFVISFYEKYQCTNNRMEKQVGHMGKLIKTNFEGI